MDEVKRTFKPEFLNRLDKIVVFDQLGSSELKHIAQTMLDQLSQRLESLGVTLRYSQKVLEHLIQKGFDPDYGARPLRRVLRSQVEDPTAELLLGGALPPGSVLELKMKEGSLALLPSPAVTPPRP